MSDKKNLINAGGDRHAGSTPYFPWAGSLPRCSTRTFGSWLETLRGIVDNDGNLMRVFQESFNRPALREKLATTILPIRRKDWEDEVDQVMDLFRLRGEQRKLTPDIVKLAQSRVDRKYKEDKEELEDLELLLKTDYALKTTINSSLTQDMKESVRHLFQDTGVSTYHLVSYLRQVHQAVSTTSRIEARRKIEMLRVKGLNYQNFCDEILILAADYRQRGGSAPPTWVWAMARDGIQKSIPSDSRFTAVKHSLYTIMDTAESIYVEDPEDESFSPMWLINRFTKIRTFIERYTAEDKDQLLRDLKTERLASHGNKKPKAKLASSTTSRPKPEGKTKSTLECYNCGGKGHLNRDCPDDCGVCKAKDHRSSTCPVRLKKSKAPSKAKARAKVAAVAAETDLTSDSE